MASVREEFTINAPADGVWAALADFGMVHRRLAPGFVTDCHLDEGGARVITFSNGAKAREVLVASDAALRRLVYASIGDRLAHHNASAQVLPEADGRCRFIWITDFLPNEFAGYISTQMAQAAAIMRDALERASTAEK
jgi:hypothetical protein